MDISATNTVPVISPSNSDADRAPAPAVPTAPVSAAPVEPVAAPPAPQVGAELRRMLEHVADRLREYLQDSQRELEFSVDEDTHATVIRVRDAVTGDLIRQIPGEDALRVLRNLSVGSGTFLDLTA